MTPFVLVLAAAALAALVWRFRAVRETTLTGPWCWLVASAIAVGAAHGATWGDPAGARAGALVYLAAVLCLCPAIAVLGAKRPQHLAWNFIVLSLWAVLAVPAAGPMITGRAESLEVHAALGWFLLGLILVGTANYWFTRFWLESLVAAAGQGLMLAHQIPMARGLIATPAGRSAGALLALAAIVAAAVRFLPSRRTPTADDRVWLDFRDLFGALWGLRLAERFNQSCLRLEWPIRLTWSGFRALAGTAAPESECASELLAATPAIRQNLDNLLRRFVGPRWIAARRAEPLD